MANFSTCPYVQLQNTNFKTIQLFKYIGNIFELYKQCFFQNIHNNWISQQSIFALLCTLLILDGNSEHAGLG